MKPRPFVEAIARGLAPGNALDLACGDGRNSIWLADRGWRVTAVDRAPMVEDPRVEVHTSDLARHEFAIQPDSWDLIVMSYYLQPDLFGAVMGGLKPGGVAIVIVLLFEPGREASRFRLHPGELHGYFEHETVLAYREEQTEGGHAIAQIAAQRKLN